MHTINITAKDGRSIPAVLYNVEKSDKKGIIIICHGFSEHSGLYKDIAEAFWSASYACTIFDQRGHGTTPLNAKKWYGQIPNYQCFIDDVVAVTEKVRQMASETPIILFGFSMGGNIAVNTLLRIPDEQANVYKCAVLEAPWLGLYKKHNVLTVCAAKILNLIMPNFTIARKQKLDDSSDENENIKYYSTDPLNHNRISIRMLTGIYNACDYALKNAYRLPVPSLIAYADNDTVVCNEDIHRFAQKAGNMVEVRGYNSKHSIHDGDREQFIHDLIAFLDSHCVLI